jgi:hypothetical protein
LLTLNPFAPLVTCGKTDQNIKDIMMRVCVTGCEGYLGSLLVPELARRGYEIVGLDTGYYKERMLYRSSWNLPYTMQ